MRLPRMMPDYYYYYYYYYYFGAHWYFIPRGIEIKQGDEVSGMVIIISS